MRRLEEISLSERDRAAVVAAAATLRERFAVAEVILFGSKARGDDRPDSDIDLLVLTVDDLDWNQQGCLTFDLVELAVDHGVLIEPLIESAQRWRTGARIAPPLREAVAREGVLL